MSFLLIARIMMHDQINDVCTSLKNGQWFSEVIGKNSFLIITWFSSINDRLFQLFRKTVSFFETSLYWCLNNLKNKSKVIGLPSECAMRLHPYSMNIAMPQHICHSNTTRGHPEDTPSP